MNMFTSFRIFLVRSVLVVTCSLAIASRAQEPTIAFHFINVGQGAATLIESKCGVVLIDAGAQDDELPTS